MNKIKQNLIFLIVFLYLLNLVYAQNLSLHSGKFYDLKQGEEKIKFEFYNKTYDIFKIRNFLANFYHGFTQIF